MKFKLNRAFREASGELDGLIYRNIRGNVVASRKPDMTGVVYSENQIAHRNRFKQAAAYGKSALANEDVRPLYEALAKEKDMPVFALMIADFFNAPEIHNVDLSGYEGRAGDELRVLASDDFRVESVHVSISDDMGTPIENGDATETTEGSGLWVYTAITSIEINNVNVQVVATDRPGGTTVKNVSRQF